VIRVWSCQRSDAVAFVAATVGAICESFSYIASSMNE
jgi:hypothetical protein